MRGGVVQSQENFIKKLRQSLVLPTNHHNIPGNDCPTIVAFNLKEENEGYLKIHIAVDIKKKRILSLVKSVCLFFFLDDKRIGEGRSKRT
jgi:hypothetical protein